MSQRRLSDPPRTQAPAARQHGPGPVRRRAALGRTRALGAAVLACVAAASGATDAMRCERGLVFPGDTRQRVLELCGEPLSSRLEQYPTWGINRLGAHVEVLVEREVWIYDRGYGRFLGQLVFKDERLERIELGARRE